MARLDFRVGEKLETAGLLNMVKNLRIGNFYTVAEMSGVVGLDLEK